MIVDSSDNCVVMTIPWHHGDLGFEEALFFCRHSSAISKDENSCDKAYKATPILKRPLLCHFYSMLLCYFCFITSSQKGLILFKMILNKYHITCLELMDFVWKQCHMNEHSYHTRLFMIYTRIYLQIREQRMLFGLNNTAKWSDRIKQWFWGLSPW